MSMPLDPADQMDKLFRGYQSIEPITIKRAADGERIISIGDTQGPFVDPKALAVVELFIKEFQPDRIFYNGDILDFYEISVFRKNPGRQFTLQDELDQATDMLDRHKVLAPKTKQYWIDGNHEARLLAYKWGTAPALASLRDTSLQSLLGLEQRSIAYQPYSGYVNYLGLVITHGDRVRKDSARTAYAMSERFRSSGLSGHSHRLGSYYWTGLQGPQVWYEQGCLCRLDPEYEANPNWQQGFAYGEVRERKVYTSLVSIFNGGFFYGGKWYGSS